MGPIRRVREPHRTVYCVAVEPADDQYDLEGLKHMASSIVPNIYDANVPAEILCVRTEGNWDMSELEGVHVGHSTGANVWSAVHLAERLHEAV